MNTIVIAECVSCKNTREIKAGEISKDEIPMCENCFMPMIAKKAKTIITYDKD